MRYCSVKRILLVNPRSVPPPNQLRRLHIFEGFAFGFADAFHDKPDRDGGEGGVETVGAAEAEGTEENRERHGNGEVRDPLDEAAHGKCGAAELIWKHFAEH